LNDFHESLGAKMIDFGGWFMPVQYRGIIEEHLHTRSKMSVFDVSHMGRLRVQGEGAEALLQWVCTRDLSGTDVGQAKYTHVCREDGGILDDVIVGRDAENWQVVCNASNRDKIVAWLNTHAEGRDARIEDETLDTVMLAIQGPAAIAFVESIVPLELSPLKRYRFLTGDFMGIGYSVYRTGYTGEDGVEVIVPSGAAGMLLPMLFGEALQADGDCKPAGLGARDTLRLEAGMPLYGHELTEEVDSLSAGQGWCVHLDKKDFCGADAMRAQRDAGLKKTLVGLEVEGRRIARQGYGIVSGGRVVGEVTSGAWSPTFEKSIAMGFVETELGAAGTTLSIDLGRKAVGARVVSLPFYKRGS
jgi:aminomethyltransferase